MSDPIDGNEGKVIEGKVVASIKEVVKGDDITGLCGEGACDAGAFCGIRGPVSGGENGVESACD